MITFFYKFSKGLLPILVAVLISSVALLSCDTDELEIQHDFPFDVEAMPVPAAIANGNTVEIRLTLERNGHYNGAQYFIRYFQFEGQGILRYDDHPKYEPNDLYLLPSEQFRLYYTSKSAVSQAFDIWISDNFGNEKKLSFEFSNGD